MRKRDRINFRVDTELRAALAAYTADEDCSEAETIREAIWLFLESEGYGRPKRKGYRKR